MGFTREARRVRDTSLPAGRRWRALSCCLEFHRPLGFHATRRFLEQRTAHPWRSPDLLLPAVDLLVDQRARFHEVDAAYAALRRQRKRAGRRFPAPSEVTARWPQRWLGEERAGARCVLEQWVADQDTRHTRDPGFEEHRVAAPVAVAVRELVGGGPGPTDLAPLQEGLVWSRRQIHVTGWEADPSAYHVAWHLERLLAQLHLATGGAVVLGEPWRLGPRPPG